MNIIEQYVKQYYQDLVENEINYSRLADYIIEDVADINMSHRTLRRKLSEEFNRQQELKEHSSLMGNKKYKAMLADNFTTNIPKIQDMINKSYDAQGYVEQGCGWVEPNTRSYSPYEAVNRANEIFSKRLKRGVVIGCVHFPFHNVDAWNAFLNFLSENGMDFIILNGDIIDNHSISRHAKGKITIPGLTLEEEYRLTNIELDRLDKVLGDNVEKYFLYGNHEMWYYDYMSQPDAHKLGQGVVKSPAEALRLKERGYKVQTNYKTAHVILGDLEVHHGTYVNKHAANKHAEAMRRNNVFNHTHRTGSYLEGNIFSYNLGWMGDKTQAVFGYMDRIQKETWTNGFGIVTIDEDGVSHVEQVTWKNNRFVYGGKIYR